MEHKDFQAERGNEIFIGATGKHGEDCFYHYTGNQSASSTYEWGKVPEVIEYWEISCPEKINVPTEKLVQFGAEIDKQNEAISRHNHSIETFGNYLQENF